MRRLALAVLSLTLTTGPVLAAAGAQAAPAPALVLTVGSSPVEVGLPILVKGRAKGAPIGSKLVLQRRSADGWSIVDRTRLRKSRTFALRVAAIEGVNRLRVKLNRNRMGPKRVSEVVRVSGATPVGTPVQQPPGTPAPPVDEPARVRALILEQTNAFRAENGKPALAAMPAVDRVAQNWSEHMATSGDFSHNPEYASQMPSGWSGAAENIAYGYAVERVVAAWINSPGHRANLLGDYTHLGVGYAKSSTAAYYTQNFARY